MIIRSKRYFVVLGLFVILSCLLISCNSDLQIKQGLSKYLSEAADIKLAKLTNTAVEYQKEVDKIPEYQLQLKAIQNDLDAKRSAIYRQANYEYVPGSNVFLESMGPFTKDFFTKYKQTIFDAEAKKVYEDAENNSKDKIHELNAAIQDGKNIQNPLDQINLQIQNIQTLRDSWYINENDWKCTNVQGGYLVYGLSLGWDNKAPCNASWNYQDKLSTYAPADAYSQMLKSLLTDPIN